MKENGSLIHRSNESLPALDIGWLKLKDHFIATVGPHSGSGQALKNLLVIADANIAPKNSFSKHSHKDMEVLTWVVGGTLHHQDDKGADQFVPELNLQLMSARDGIFHAEGNATDKELRLLQIWIKPNASGGDAEIKTAALKGEGFQLLAGPENAPLIIRQDLWLYAAKLNGSATISLKDGHFGYAVIIGEMTVNGLNFFDGDGAVLNGGTYVFEGIGQVIVTEQPA